MPVNSSASQKFSTKKTQQQRDNRKSEKTSSSCPRIYFLLLNRIADLINMPISDFFLDFCVIISRDNVYIVFSRYKGWIWFSSSSQSYLSVCRIVVGRRRYWNGQIPSAVITLNRSSGHLNRHHRFLYFLRLTTSTQKLFNGQIVGQNKSIYVPWALSLPSLLAEINGFVLDHPSSSSSRRPNHNDLRLIFCGEWRQ